MFQKFEKIVQQIFKCITIKIISFSPSDMEILFQIDVVYLKFSDVFI